MVDLGGSEGTVVGCMDRCVDSEVLLSGGLGNWSSICVKDAG